MMLLIDAGNTRAKFGWIEPSAACGPAGVHVLEYGRLEQLARQLDAQGLQPTAIEASNVAGPAVADSLARFCRQRFGLPIRWRDARDGDTLMRNAYTEPRRLGADRWLGLLGLLDRVRGLEAWQRGTPVLLATFGTATTLDTIIPAAHGDDDPRPLFPGGLILPGPGLMARSLAEHTAQLPLAHGATLDYPVDTQGAIGSGIAAAQAGALLRQWRTGLERCGPGLAPPLFVAGGGWPLVQAEIERVLAQAQADLGLPPLAPQPVQNPVLDGLAALARAVRKG